MRPRMILQNRIGVNGPSSFRKPKKNAQHKHSPENLNIIQCGAGISRSAYMPKDIYDSLQATFSKMDRTYFVDFEAYIFAILEKTSLEDMQQAVNSNKLPGDKFKFIYRLFDQFANHVFKPGRKVSQVKSSEVCYNYLVLWPCLYAAINGMTTSTFGDMEFSPGEIDLLAVAEVQALRNQTELQHKADGVVHTEHLHIELLFLETTGHHGLSDRPRACWDHVKGMTGVLAMLARIAYAFPHGSADDFKNVKVAFIQARGDYLHLWTVNMPSPGIYVMQRVIKALVPTFFLEKHHLVSLINFFWTVRVEISKMIDALEKLKKTHVANELAIMLKGNRSGIYLPDLLKPVKNILNKKTDYAGVGRIDPKSSPISEYG
ncbi:hypothetical protein BC936DRAFT_137468 [Jimgerdemannia flammicorona]|uniref:Uncharacterized protein n=1 Tax=Jimgerdemannia flammicorona TaxID=994334 RepID=A0A433CXB6_9FUNG|nr:hypothetical protein BC936DRAFT_137468 [Jimgerdemannia flammicorona]